jgi:hydrogenase-4 component E
MNPALDVVLMVVALINLALLGTSRLATCIRLSALQGVVLCLLPPLASRGDLSARMVLFMAAMFVLKGVVFPKLLFRALRAADVRHEVEPFVRYIPSIVLGMLLLGLSFWLSTRLELPTPASSPLVLPVALTTILTSLLIIVTRRKALSQVIGYLVLENGILVFGAGLALDEPLVVEIGILLDVFVAVFVMGIAIFHISREFDHIDVDQLSVLKDGIEP